MLITRRRVIAVLSLVLLAAAAVVAAVLLRRHHVDPVSRAIRERVAQAPDQPFDLATLTGFEWDRVYVFPPYSSRAEIEAALGVMWPELGGSAVETNDGVALIVFVRDGRVVRSFDHPRDHGDFAPIPARAGLTRTSARFVANRDGGQGPAVIRLAPPSAEPPATEPPTTEPTPTGPPATGPTTEPAPSSGPEAPAPAPSPAPEPEPSTGPATAPASGDVVAQ